MHVLCAVDKIVVIIVIPCPCPSLHLFLPRSPSRECDYWKSVIYVANIFCGSANELLPPKKNNLSYFVNKKSTAAHVQKTKQIFWTLANKWSGVFCGCFIFLYIHCVSTRFAILFENWGKQIRDYIDKHHLSSPLKRYINILNYYCYYYLLLRHKWILNCVYIINRRGSGFTSVN